MKSLYNKNYRYTSEAEAIDREAHNALKLIFKEWYKNGYSPREIAHIINGTVTDFELESVLGWDIKI